MPFFITQTRSCHHGASGQSAGRSPLVSENKRVIVGVLALAMATVVGKGRRPGNASGIIGPVRRVGDTIHVSFCLFF